jgi:photosystem II stability/assembly factor-like uncharacterized protein
MTPSRALIVTGFLLTGTLALATSWRGINSGLPSVPIGVRNLTIHPTTGDIYADTASGLFKSTDDGGSWTAFTAVSGDLTLDPNDPSTLYIRDLSGLRKSVDGGATWARTGPPDTTPFSLGSLAISPGDSSQLYLTASSPNGALLFRSTDGGATWDTTGAPGVSWLGSPIFAPANPAKIYFPFFKSVNSGSVAGIAIAANQGQTWTTISIPGAAEIHALAIDPSRESVIYAAVVLGYPGGNEFLKTTDGGRSWSALNDGLPRNSAVGPLVIDRSAPSTVYARYTFVSPGCGGCGGLVKTTDGGTHWTIIRSTPAEGVGYTFALDPTVPGTMYAGIYHSLDAAGEMFRSADGGASWSLVNGPGLIDVHAMAVNSVNPSIIYASAGDSVFQSVDYGENWAQLVAFQTPVIPPPPPLGQLMSGGPAIANALAVDFANPNVLYARTAHYNGCFFLENFLFKSTDGGASWTDTISPPASGCVLTTFWDPPWMVMDPSDPATLYVGESFEGGSAVIKTSDGGVTWRDIWQLWTDDFPDAVHALAIDPSDNRTLYAGLSFRGGVYKSADGGGNWSSTGLNGVAISALAIDPGNPGVLYAATEGVYPQPRGFRGLFKTTDGSSNWAEANRGLDGLLQSGYVVTGITIDPANSNTVYLATSGAGVFQSVDGGANWTSNNDGLGNLDVHVLLPGAGNAGTLYAGTAAGVFAVPSMH